MGAKTHFLGLAIGVTASLATHAEEGHLQINPQWQYVSDRVMGGVSGGQMSRDTVAGREAVRLTGQVSLANNGGFVQMAFDLPADGADPSDWRGIEIEVFGNNETYEIRLRTSALTRPWQSFRMSFVAAPEWQTLRLPFSDFEAHRTEANFEAGDLRRIGILAIGRAFEADVAVARIGFFR